MKFSKIITFIILVISITSCGGENNNNNDTTKKEDTVPQAVGVWTEKTAMPTARAGFRSASVNGKIFVIGGYIEGRLGLVEEYDTSTNTWTNCGIPAPGNGCASMGDSRSNFGISVVDEKIYVMGGRSEPTTWLSSVEVYNPITNRWSSKSDMLNKKDGLVAITIDNNIYAIGGGLYGAGVGIAVYNTIADEWTTKSSIPTEYVTSNFSATHVNGLIYLTGGYDLSAKVNVNKVFEYDPITEIWTSMASMVAVRSNHISVAFSNKLYVYGGDKSYCSGITSVEVYDISNNRWSSETEIPFSIPTCSDLSASVSDGKAYLTWGTMSGRSIFYEFSP